MHAINYRTSDFAEEVKRITGGAGDGSAAGLFSCNVSGVASYSNTDIGCRLAKV